MPASPSAGPPLDVPARDPSHIEGIYRTRGARCYDLARSIVRDDELARAVVQEVFRSLWRNPELLDPDRGTLLTRLMTLTHDRAVDVARRAGRRASLETSSATFGVLTDPAPGPYGAVDARGKHDGLRVALAQVAPREREVLMLAYFGSCTQTEIADRLQIPLSTARSRMLSGLRHLRAALDASRAGVPYPAVPSSEPSPR